VGIYSIVFGFTPVNGLHVESVAQDKGNVFLDTEIGDPIPCEHAFCGHDDIRPVRLDDLQKGLPIGADVSMKSDFSGRIEDADIHFFGMQVDSAIKFVLFSVKSHMASSFGLKCLFVLKAFYHASGGGLI
jgi:hypothetical protein